MKKSIGVLVSFALLLVAVLVFQFFKVEHQPEPTEAEADAAPEAPTPRERTRSLLAEEPPPELPRSTRTFTPPATPTFEPSSPAEDPFENFRSTATGGGYTYIPDWADRAQALCREGRSRATVPSIALDGSIIEGETSTLIAWCRLGNLYQYRYTIGSDRRATYGSDGLLRLVESDEDGDGHFEYRDSMTWDEDGNQASHTLEWLTADGELDEWVVTTFEGGQMSHMESNQHSEHGRVIGEYNYEYDDAGELTRATTSIDRDGDGYPELVTSTYQLSHSEREEVSEIDLDGDAIVERRRIWRYRRPDDSERYDVVSCYDEFDRDGDGEFEERQDVELSGSGDEE